MVIIPVTAVTITQYCTQSYRVTVIYNQGCGVLFCETPTLELENLGLQTPNSLTPAVENLDSDSDSGHKIRLRLRHYDLLCDIGLMIANLRMT